MRIWRAWATLLTRREDGTSLALMRILVGCVVAFDLLSTFGSGVIGFMWGDIRDTAEGFREFDIGGLFGLLGGAHYGTVRAVVVATSLAALMLAAGVAPRIAAFLALQGCIALFHLNPLAGGGHDRVATNALWLLVLADSGRTLSVGCRWRTGRWTDPTPVATWPRFLVILQLTLIYSATGLQKMLPEWFPWGRWLAVYNMLLVPTWARYDLAPVLGWFGPVTQLSTAVTWFWECTFGVVLLSVWMGWHRVRTFYAALGALFHIGLAVLTNLGPFSAITLALYPCLFRPDEWRRLSAGVSVTRSRRSTSSSNPSRSGSGGR